MRKLSRTERAHLSALCNALHSALHTLRSALCTHRQPWRCARCRCASSASQRRKRPPRSWTSCSNPSTSTAGARAFRRLPTAFSRLLSPSIESLDIDGSGDLEISEMRVALYARKSAQSRGLATRSAPRSLRPPLCSSLPAVAAPCLPRPSALTAPLASSPSCAKEAAAGGGDRRQGPSLTPPSRPLALTPPLTYTLLFLR